MSTEKGIRITATDDTHGAVLQEALLKAIYNPGIEPLPEEILREESLIKYYESWGKRDDFGYVAIDVNTNTVIGACWCRLFTSDNRGYGYVDEETPELSIAVWESYRNQGTGTKLLDKTIREARSRGYSGLSLSVQKENQSVGLYRKKGFRVLRSSDDAYIMHLSF